MIPGTNSAPSFVPRANPAVFALGILALGVATFAAGALAYEKIQGVALPGCGVGSACAQLANSKWGSIPGIKWPTSFVGAAYFAAMLAAWIGAKGVIPTWLRFVATLGALGSAAFIGIMLGMGHSGADTICPYCLTSHLANFAFLGLLALSPRPEMGEDHPLRAPGAALAALVIVTGGLGAVDGRANEKAQEGFKQQADDATRQIIENSQRAKQQQSAESSRQAPPQSAAILPTAGTVPGTPASAPAPAASSAPAAPSQPAATKAPPMTPLAQPQPLPPAGVFTGRYRAGPENAPIRIVMFTDYQCPDCRQMETQVEAVMHDHPEASVSIKYFPFCTDCNEHVANANYHPNACWAARAAEAAGMIYGTEGFWRMHRWLFSKAGGFTSEELNAGLTELGLAPDQAAHDRFIAVMTGPDTLARVKQDIDEAVMYGIMTTPFIFVNGVELAGWKAQNSLVNQVNTVSLAKLDPAGPDVDHPVKAKDAFITGADGWINQPAMAWPDRAKPYTQVPLKTAKVRVTMWGDLLEPNCEEADKTIRNTVQGDPNVAYEFRYFPFDKDCNRILPRQIIENGCKAAKAMEAAGQLGGTDAYWQMHTWISEHPKEFSEEAAKAQAVKIGLKGDEFVAKMKSPEVEAIIQADIELGSRVGVQEIPRIHVNGRWVKRWKTPNGFVLERIIDKAHSPAPPPPPNANPAVPQLPGVNAPFGQPVAPGGGH